MGERRAPRAGLPKPRLDGGDPARRHIVLRRHLGRRHRLGTDRVAAACLFRPHTRRNPRHRSGVPEGPRLAGGAVHQPRQRHRRDGAQSAGGRRDPSRHVRMTPGFRVAQFMAAVFTVTAVNAFMPLWFADRGLTPAAIGQVLGLASLFRVMAGPGWGTMADRVGKRRPVMMAAAGTATMLSLCYTPLRGFAPILLVTVTLGIVASALGPLADSLALALAREGKLEYGPVRAAGSIAYMVVTAASGQGLAYLGATLVPWLQALGYGLAALFARLLPEAATPPASPRVFGGWQLFRLQPFRLTVACTALIQGSHAAYYGFAALFWRSQGIGDGTIGLLFAEAI